MGGSGLHNVASDMKIHLAEGSIKHHSFAQLQASRSQLRFRVLLSYFYYLKSDLDAVFNKGFTQPYPDVFLDSGAWTAFTKGATIDLDEYCGFIRRYSHLITTFCNLDDMNDPQHTWENQQRMEEKGVPPLPVFHTGEPFEYLERYVERYAYVGLGKIIPYTQSPDVIFPWLVKCFRIAGDRTVFYGLGVTNWKMLCSFPWYSVDSSSWGSGFRYGRVPLFDERQGRFVGVQLGDMESCRRYGGLIERLGFDPMDFAKRSRNRRDRICAISALSYMLAERWLRRRHGPVSIPERDVVPAGLAAYLPGGSLKRQQNADGLNIHLADSVALNLELAQRGRSAVQEKEDGSRIYLVHDKTELKSALAAQEMEKD